MNISKKTLIVWVGLSMTLAIPAKADVMVYPAKGQGQQQMEQDKFECYGWAKNQTGFDPMHATSPSAYAQYGAEPGGVVRGGARGAAVGAVGGAIGGNAGKGAAIGAATGAMIGGIRRRSAEREQDEANAQMQQQYQAARNEYNRAYGACLEGRGYSVK